MFPQHPTYPLENPKPGDYTQIGDHYAYTVEVEAPYVVHIYAHSDPHPEGWPILFQPFHPDTPHIPFQSYEEAEAYAIEHINTHYIPNHGKTPEEAKPTVASLEAKLESIMKELSALKEEQTN